MKKQFIALILWVAVTLTGCHRMVPEEAPSLRVYASFYPVYAMAAVVVDGVPDMTLTCLTQPQMGCPRAYQLSDWDAALLQEADAIMIGGRGLEAFESALDGGELPVISVMDGLALIGEDEAIADAEDAGHFVGANPWLWLSPDGARAMAESMAAAMAQLDPRYADQYERNYRAFAARIDALPGERLTGRVGVLHEGLAYLADALGLTVAHTVEREPATYLEDNELAAAVDSLREGQVEVLLVEAQAPDRLTRDLEGAGFTVVKIDTFVSGGDYISVMQNNIDAIARALA